MQALYSCIPSAIAGNAVGTGFVVGTLKWVWQSTVICPGPIVQNPAWLQLFGGMLIVAERDCHEGRHALVTGCFVCSTTKHG